MKKIILAVGLLFAALPLVADTRSDELLSSLSSHIGSMGDYNVVFTAEVGGSDVDGIYAVSGAKFYMRAADYEVVCDGKVQYRINHAEREVEIDKVNPGDRNIMSNPTKAFEFAPDLFAGSYKGEEKIGGAVCDVVDLKPVGNGNLMSEVILKIDRATGLPAEIIYVTDDSYDDVRITINSIVKGLPKGTVFRFDRSAFKGYELLDFR